MQSVQDLSPHAQLLWGALLAAYYRLADLGKAGKVKAPNLVKYKNDPKLVGDVESEKAMLDVVTSFAQQHGYLIHWLSEELGQITIGTPRAGQKVFTVLADGIDGTENYVLSNPIFDAAPMIAIARGSNPTYDDFLAGGAVTVSDGWMIIADVETDAVIWYQIRESNNPMTVLPKFLTPSGVDMRNFLADPYTDAAKNVLGKNVDRWIRTGSTGATAVLLALQGTWRSSKLPAMDSRYEGLIADATDKGDLEQPVLYLIMRLLGGYMFDMEGVSFGNRVFLEFGANVGMEVPFMCVPTPCHLKVARELLGLPKLGS